MKVYLAAPYSMKNTVSEAAEELRGLGIEVTSRWLTEPHDPKIHMSALQPKDHEIYGTRDIEDVAKADLMVLWTDPTQSIIRQGRTAEMGMGLMINHLGRYYPILVVGMQYENIFHYQKNVEHFESWEKVRTALEMMQANYNQVMEEVRQHNQGL